MNKLESLIADYGDCIASLGRIASLQEKRIELLEKNLDKYSGLANDLQASLKREHRLQFESDYL